MFNGNAIAIKSTPANLLVPSGIEWVTEGQKSSFRTSGSGPASIDAPDDIESGDLLVFIVTSPNESFDLESGTPPAGFTFAGEGGDLPITGAFDPIIQVYVKVATGSEPASYSFTPNNEARYAASISRVTGASSVGDFEAGYESSSTLVTCPSVTPTSPTSLLVCVAGVRSNRTVSSVPTGMTEAVNIDTGSSFPSALGVAIKAVAGTDPTGEQDFTLTGNAETATCSFTLE